MSFSESITRTKVCSRLDLTGPAHFRCQFEFTCYICGDVVHLAEVQPFREQTVLELIAQMYGSPPCCSSHRAPSDRTWSMSL